MAPIRLSRSERGAELVEFAVALPVLLVLVAGIVDFGFLFQRYEVITNAAREGARLASLAPNYTNAAVQTRVRQYIQTGLNLTNAQLDAAVDPTTGVSVTNQTINTVTPNISTRLVVVNYQHTFVMLGPVMRLINANWGNGMTITSSSEMRLEAAPAATGS
jgi:Flp pilus assembly protein TadG